MKKSYKKTLSGFTLIEVMITIVVVAILMSIALPSYRSTVLKAKRSAAKTVLFTIASKQETFRLDNKTYADTFVKLGYDATLDATTDKLYVDDQNNVSTTSADSVYEVVINSGTANTFLLTATTTSNTSQDDDTNCKTFSINQLNVKISKDSSNAAHDCW